MMRLIIAENDPRVIAERWKDQYQRKDGTWSNTIGGPADETYAKILSSSVGAREIESHSGVSWGLIRCWGCGNNTDCAVEVCQTDEGDPQFCKECLKAAIVLFLAE